MHGSSKGCHLVILEENPNGHVGKTMFANGTGVLNEFPMPRKEVLWYDSFYISLKPLHFLFQRNVFQTSHSIPSVYNPRQQVNIDQSGLGREGYNSRQREGSDECRYPHHPWNLFPWTQYGKRRSKLSSTHIGSVGLPGEEWPLLKSSTITLLE
jgi:hypothetical protein